MSGADLGFSEGRVKPSSAWIPEAEGLGAHAAPQKLHAGFSNNTEISVLE